MFLGVQSESIGIGSSYTFDLSSWFLDPIANVATGTITAAIVIIIKGEGLGQEEETIQIILQSFRRPNQPLRIIIIEGILDASQNKIAT